LLHESVKCVKHSVLIKIINVLQQVAEKDCHDEKDWCRAQRMWCLRWF
jgi:hypothetical protein